MSPRPSQQAVGSGAPPAVHLGGRRASAGERRRGVPTSARRQRAVACRSDRSERCGDRSAPTPNQTKAPPARCRPPSHAHQASPIAACMRLQRIAEPSPNRPQPCRPLCAARPSGLATLPAVRRPCSSGLAPRWCSGHGTAGWWCARPWPPSRPRCARSGVHAGLHVWRPLQLT